ncbi:hypothetical protein ACLOJK_030068 [Asimina triloba]
MESLDRGEEAGREEEGEAGMAASTGTGTAAGGGEARAKQRRGRGECESWAVEPCEAGEDVNGGGLPAGSRLDRGVVIAESWQPTLMGMLLVVGPPRVAVGRADGAARN